MDDNGCDNARYGIDIDIEPKTGWLRVRTGFMLAGLAGIFDSSKSNMEPYRITLW